MFLLVPAYPGCPGSKAVKRSLLLLLLLLVRYDFNRLAVYLSFRTPIGGKLPPPPSGGATDLSGAPPPGALPMDPAGGLSSVSPLPPNPGYATEHHHQSCKYHMPICYNINKTDCSLSVAKATASKQQNENLTYKF